MSRVNILDHIPDCLRGWFGSTIRSPQAEVIFGTVLAGTIGWIARPFRLRIEGLPDNPPGHLIRFGSLKRCLQISCLVSLAGRCRAVADFLNDNWLAGRGT